MPSDSDDSVSESSSSSDEDVFPIPEKYRLRFEKIKKRPFEEKCPLRTVRQSMLYHKRFILKEEIPVTINN